MNPKRTPEAKPTPLDRSDLAIIALAGLLFVLILALRLLTDAAAAHATLVLFVVPIALCAIRFGTRGGVAAALLALGLMGGAEVVQENGVGPLGLATRATAYLLVGILLGRFVDERQALEAKVERHYELSLDLFGTANFDGYFVELNPAWAQTLGYTNAELRSRPFIDFVHPDDRERTEAEASKLATEGTDTIRFRNRYRRADGTYVWLEWNCRPVAEERCIYATARDITVQREAEKALQAQNDLLERRVRDRTSDLERARLETLQRLAIATEYRDDDTHQHTERVGRTAALLAREVGLSVETVSLMRHAAPLHDIGKVGIPDAILLKPGRLTEEEFELMKEHAAIGATILAGGEFAVVRLARQIALTHHEHWDGAGYPAGLSADQIPLAGRLTAVADVFDALTHDRPYKGAWPVEDAVAEILGLAGKHFDPQLVDAFATLQHERLLASVQEFDLELPPPPLTTPAEADKRSNGRPATSVGARAKA